MQTAALYIRVSTDDQTEYSPDAQRRALLDYAERSNIAVPEKYIYIDEGISGRRAEKRPAFMAMIAAARKKPKPFDLILVHKFDRFARNREDSIVYKSLLRRECGVTVVSITERIEDDRFSVILEAMLEAMAEYYSLNLADEVKKGMTEKARRGEYQTCAPFGYRLEQGRLFQVPEQAAVVRQMYEDYLYRGKSPFGIARELNALGLRTLRGNPWENRTIKYILQNPLYKGFVRWNPEGRQDLRAQKYLSGNFIIERGNHEPIVPETLWQAVNDRLSAADCTRTGRKPPELHAHWLSGLLRCSCCGGSLSSAGAKLSAFQCGNYSRGKCPVSHYISYQRAETAVCDAFRTFTSDSVYSRLPSGSAPGSGSCGEDSQKLMMLQENLTKLTVKEKRACDAYLAGVDTLTEYEENRRKLSDERRKLETAIRELLSAEKKDRSSGLPRHVRSILDVISSDADNTVKGSAIRSIVDRIVFDKSSGRLDIFLSGQRTGGNCSPAPRTD